MAYRGFLDAINRQDLDGAEQYIDVERYRENCVRFTEGVVNWQYAKAAVLASYFDFVRIDNGQIVYRVQQADVLGQMRQLFGRVLGTAALGALIMRI